jgi:hypothetical protein
MRPILLEIYLFKIFVMNFFYEFLEIEISAISQLNLEVSDGIFDIFHSKNVKFYFQSNFNELSETPLYIIFTLLASISLKRHLMIIFKPPELLKNSTQNFHIRWKDGANINL